MKPKKKKQIDPRAKAIEAAAVTGEKVLAKLRLDWASVDSIATDAVYDLMVALKKAASYKKRELKFQEMVTVLAALTALVELGIDKAADDESDALAQFQAELMPRLKF